MENLGIECKKLMAKEIKERAKTSANLFITSFGSITVPEQDLLRSKLKEIDASLLVVKRRIVKQVFEQLKLKRLSALMQGLTAIVLGGKDSLLVSKTLVNFTGKNNNFRVLGAYVESQLLEQDSIKRLASIPSKEALFTQIVCGIQSPIQGLVNTLSGTIRNFVVVINQIQEKLKESSR